MAARAANPWGAGDAGSLWGSAQGGMPWWELKTTSGPFESAPFGKASLPPPIAGNTAERLPVRNRKIMSKVHSACMLAISPGVPCSAVRGAVIIPIKLWGKGACHVAERNGRVATRDRLISDGTPETFSQMASWLA